MELGAARTPAEQGPRTTAIRVATLSLPPGPPHAHAGLLDWVWTNGLRDDAASQANYDHPDPLHHRVGWQIGPMLATPLDSIRLWLHILGATVWVGGQLTLAALVPALRAAGPDVPKRAAQAFNKVAWPAFGLLLVTGVWNIAAVNAADHPNSAYQAVLGAKLVVVAASGLSAWQHTRATSTNGLAIWGALTGLTALSALYLGVLLAG